MALLIPIGLAAVAGIVALAIVVRNGSTRGGAATIALCVGLAVLVLADLAAVSYVSLFIVKPLLPVIAALALLAASVALFVIVGRDVKWQPARVAALVGLVVLGAGVAGAIMMVVSTNGVLGGALRTRAAQLGAKHGFTTLMPTEGKLQSDTLPIGELDNPPEPGLSIGYEDFQIQERKGPAEATYPTLQKIVAPGAKPLGNFPGAVPAGTVSRAFMVNGVNAIGVEFPFSPEADKLAGASTPGGSVTLLVFARNGTDVRIWSTTTEKLRGKEWVPAPPLALSELVRIAGTLQPVE